MMCVCGHGSEEHLCFKGKHGSCMHIMRTTKAKVGGFEYVTWCECEQYKRRRRGAKFQSSTYRKEHAGQ